MGYNLKNANYHCYSGVSMPSEGLLYKGKVITLAEAQEIRRQYLLKSLMQYGFTEEQSKDLLEGLDEFVEEKKDLTEEAKDSLYKG
jgi:hypothetical protein